MKKTFQLLKVPKNRAFKDVFTYSRTYTNNTKKIYKIIGVQNEL